MGSSWQFLFHVDRGGEKWKIVWTTRSFNLLGISRVSFGLDKQFIASIWFALHAGGSDLGTWQCLMITWFASSMLGVLAQWCLWCYLRKSATVWASEASKFLKIIQNCWYAKHPSCDDAHRLFLSCASPKTVQYVPIPYSVEAGKENWDLTDLAKHGLVPRHAKTSREVKSPEQSRALIWSINVDNILTSKYSNLPDWFLDRSWPARGIPRSAKVCSVSMSTKVEKRGCASLDSKASKAASRSSRWHSHVEGSRGSKHIVVGIIYNLHCVTVAW